MPLRVDDRPTELREVTRFEGGASWIAHPEETMRRSSHALEVDGDVWVIDPVDAGGLDEVLDELGEVAGVVVLFGRHRRDAAAIADRHGVPVYLPDWFEGVVEDLPAETPVARFGATLSETELEARVVKKGRFWQEVALYDADRGTLVVPESVGTAPYFRAGGEDLGVHPMRRAFPPREELEPFARDRDLERVLVGHGNPVLTGASMALADALSGARSRTPRLYAESAMRLLPF